MTKENELSPQGEIGETLPLRVPFFGHHLDIPLESKNLPKMEEILAKHGRELALGGALVAGATAIFCYIKSKKPEQKPAPEPKERIVSSFSLPEAKKQEFEELYSRLFKGIFTFALMRTAGNSEDAKDLTQQVFTRAWAAWPKFNEKIGLEKGLEDPPRAWLYRIAQNLASNRSRDKIRHPTIPLEAITPPPSQNEERIFGFNPEAQKVFEAVKGFSPDWQLIIVLKHVEELSNQEIGAILGKREGAIKAIHFRAIERLRKKLPSFEVSAKMNG